MYISSIEPFVYKQDKVNESWLDQSNYLRHATWIKAKSFQDTEQPLSLLQWELIVLASFIFEIHKSKSHIEIAIQG